MPFSPLSGLVDRTTVQSVRTTRSPPAPKVIAGMPSGIGRLESVEDWLTTALPMPGASEQASGELAGVSCWSFSHRVQRPAPRASLRRRGVFVVGSYGRYDGKSIQPAQLGRIGRRGSTSIVAVGGIALMLAPLNSATLNVVLGFLGMGGDQSRYCSAGHKPVWNSKSPECPPGPQSYAVTTRT